MPQLRPLFLSPSQDQVIDYLDRELLLGEAQLLKRPREFTSGCPAPVVRLLKGRRQWSTPLFTGWLPAPVSNNPFCLKMSFCKTLSHNLFFSPLQMNNCLGRSFVLTAALPGTQVLRDFWYRAQRVRANGTGKFCKTQEEIFMRKDFPSAETMSFCLWDTHHVFTETEINQGKSSVA